MTRDQQARLFYLYQQGYKIHKHGVRANLALKKHVSGMVTMVMYFANRGKGKSKSRSVSLDTVDIKLITVFKPVTNWLETTDETKLGYWRKDEN